MIAGLCSLLKRAFVRRARVPAGRKRLLAVNLNRPQTSVNTQTNIVLRVWPEGVHLVNERRKPLFPDGKDHDRFTRSAP